MNKVFNSLNKFGLVVTCVFFSLTAHAGRIEVAEDSAFIIQFAAAVILFAHISGGAIGIAAGLVASLARKGSVMHKRAGKVFLYSMVICYVIAAIVAPFLASEQRTNFVAAVLALYLLLSGFDTAKRRNFIAGTKEVLGLFVALAITLMGIYFIWLAQHSPTGTVDGAPPQAFILFVVAGSAALVGELYVLIKKTLSNDRRIVRHLWRLSMSFFIASGSLFFGQATFFPAWFNSSLLPVLFGFFPLVVLFIGVSQSFPPIQKLIRKLLAINIFSGAK